MEIIIQYREGKEYVVGVGGQGKGCPGCGVTMQLVLQEASSDEDVLTGWWFCNDCNKTDKLKVDASMFM